MIASLPMYDRPETAGLNDRLWSAVRARLGPEAPRYLTRSADPWQDWLRPDLLLSQTCGCPYRRHLHGRVALVGTPVWDLPCPPGRYYSVLVVRAADPRAAACDFAAAWLAYNDSLSQSGWAAPQTHAAGAGFGFAQTLHTGSHRASSRAVAEGRADIAALDAISWRLIRQFDPWADALRVLAETEPTPALPYICAPDQAPEGLAAALAGAIAEMTPADRAVLGLAGLTHVPASAYLAVPDPPGPQAFGAPGA